VSAALLAASARGAGPTYTLQLCAPDVAGSTVNLPVLSEGATTLVKTSASRASCNATLSTQGAAAIAISFVSFKVSLLNYVRVTTLSGAVLLAAATGTSLPPSLLSTGTVFVEYDVSVPDPHDAVVGDGVVMAVTSVALTASSANLGACSQAALCSACASAPGCVWCAGPPPASANATHTGACLYSGFSAAFDAAGELTALPNAIAPAVCANASAVYPTRGGACPDVVVPGPGAVSAAFAAAAAPEWYWLYGIAAAFFLHLVLFATLYLLKRSLSKRTGKRTATSVELAVLLLLLVKLTEFGALYFALAHALASVAATGAVDLIAADGLWRAATAWAPVLTLATSVQYAANALVGYSCVAFAPRSKHGFCGAVLLAAPAIAVGAAVGVLNHYLRGSLPLGSFFAPSPLVWPLSAEVCHVNSRVTLPSGADAVAVVPMRLPVLYLVGAAAILVAAIAVLTAVLMGVAAAELETTLPLKPRPPLLRGLGATLTMLSQPLGAAAITVALCTRGADASPSALLPIYFAPALVQIAGLAVVLVAQAWQLKIDARVAPVLVKEGIRLDMAAADLTSFNPAPAPVVKTAPSPSWKKADKGGGGGSIMARSSTGTGRLDASCALEVMGVTGATLRRADTAPREVARVMG
jgi:hypothetical protein